MTDLEYYHGRRVLVTGSTGFKGSWLCRALTLAGADVTGYALTPPTDPSLFVLADVGGGIRQVTGDVRDFDALRRAFGEARPEVVLHLAAQPLVRESYRDPRGTYETNVMGTVNVMECVRRTDSVVSVVNVTTDKVYRNREWVWGYREDEELDGYDPYANSKSCSELVTRSYVRSFFAERGLPVTTARAGNVIGGGDFAAERIIPDCVRAAAAGGEIRLRRPGSVRPYQHVLEPVMAYLTIAARQAKDPALAGSYNVGPEESGCLTTGELAELFAAEWGGGLTVVRAEEDGPHEANFLRLDCAKLRQAFGWRERWDVREAVRRTVAWSRCWLEGGDVRACMDEQIRSFVGEAE